MIQRALRAAGTLFVDASWSYYSLEMPTGREIADSCRRWESLCGLQESPAQLVSEHGMGKVGKDHWRSSSPFFASRITQSTFLRIVSSDSFWISPEETPQPLWVWHVSLAEDLRCEGCAEE